MKISENSIEIIRQKAVELRAAAEKDRKDKIACRQNVSFNPKEFPIKIGEYAKRYGDIEAVGNYLTLEVCPINKCQKGFTISPTQDIFYCFKCHKGGDLLELHSLVNNCSPRESMENLLIEQIPLENKKI